MNTCKNCGNPETQTPIRRDGFCLDCERHPPGTKWKGGTIPASCELYVMPTGWKPGETLSLFPITSPTPNEREAKRR